VSVAGPKRDLHSGVDGGTIVEPLMDLLAVLGSLVDARGELGALALALALALAAAAGGESGACLSV
jgi:hypothetical protein